MNKNHLDPAKSIIRKFGGPGSVSRITGKHISRVYRWMHPRERGGTGGIIPLADAQKLLGHARSEGIELDPREFFTSADDWTVVRVAGGGQ